eukprot:999713-Prymnesium_polylepis.1
MLMRGCGAWAVWRAVLLARARHGASRMVLRSTRGCYDADARLRRLALGCFGLCESIRLGEGRSRPGLR